MNPLTLVKRTQKINSIEANLGISDDASWHAKYKDSAYIFVGGISFDLTEGDLLAVFAQYGEIVDVNLVRDKSTGKSKGFAFLAYEDQRSTILAVDNLNGAKISGRIVRVDHVSNYKKKEEEDEEREREKREERGVCRAFQRGECNRGASCKFSHDEQRCANTGWGENNSRWGNDRYDEDPPNIPRISTQSRRLESRPESSQEHGRHSSRSDPYNERSKQSSSSSNHSSKGDGNEKLPERSRSERRRKDDRDLSDRGDDVAARGDDKWRRQEKRGSSSQYYDRYDDRDDAHHKRSHN